MYKLKRVSAQRLEINKAIDVLKIIVGDIKKDRPYRTRKVWSLKRSPHVFSKSQESFGYEVYNMLSSFNPKSPLAWPIDFKLIFNIVIHRQPGLHWSWTRKKYSWLNG